MKMNIVKIAVCCCVLLACSARSMGQGNVGTITHTVFGGAGMKHAEDRLLDLSSANINVLTFGYSLQSLQGRALKKLNVSLETGSTASGKTGARTRMLNLQYLSTIALAKNKRSRFQNFTGYAIGVNPEYIQSGDHYSWATTGTLGIYHSLQYNWETSRLQFDVSVPLIGFRSRPAVAAVQEGAFADMLYNSFRSIQLATIGRMKAGDVSIKYQHRFGTAWSLFCGATASYRELANGNSFREYSFLAAGGIAWHLR